MSLRTRSTFDNTTNTARSYPPLGQDEKSFSKSKSICVSTWRKSPWIRAIWTPPGGRKKGRLCFIKRKDKRYISNNRNFKQKNIDFLRQKKNGRQKQVDFFSIRVLFCVFLLSFQQKVEPPFHTRHRLLFLARVDTLANGHAPAHRALNDFAFLAFTLHLHT